MSELRATITRGEHKDKPLFPHKHEDGKYVASTSRFEDDYVRVDTLEELEVLIKAGYGARMSNANTGNAPSFIVNRKISFGDSSRSSVSAVQLLPSIIDEADLDRDSKTKSRKEQSFLRAYLLGNSSTGTCVICKHGFPFNMLVAAHLKKRAECTTKEKKDFSNVAALMCKTGCDDLYENGYISVQGGKVVQTKMRAVTARLSEVISGLVGNEVANWPSSAKYYEWHHSKFNK
jgi:hypothetical protein